MKRRIVFAAITLVGLTGSAYAQAARDSNMTDAAQSGNTSARDRPNSSVGPAHATMPSGTMNGRSLGTDGGAPTGSGMPGSRNSN